MQAQNLQTFAYPVPKSLIFIADAAAIKVCPLYVRLIGCLRPLFVGDHNLSC
jgi:hypothetical protein